MTQLAALRRMLDSRAMTRFVQVIAVISLMVSLAVAGQQYRLTNCLARYNDAQAAASRHRTVAAEEDRQAVDEMVKAVVNSRSRTESHAALEAYLQTRAAADERRARNPLPAGPSQLCS